MAEYADQLSFSDTNDEYKAFVDKFKPKKTTDDCYTPENIYDAVCGWVEMEYGVSRDRFVRPFWPGGDYQRFEYPEGCIVVDNPPFSIITQIKNFYTSRGIDFFLFAPSLTLIGGYKRGQGVSYIAAGADVIYENGANVKTGFITTLDDCLLRSAPSLYDTIKAANDENQKKIKKQLPKYSYPDYVVTAAMVQQYSAHNTEYRLDERDAQFIRGMDAQRSKGKSVFGGGFLLSERAAAERAAAERAAAERAAATKWQLSERERALVAALSNARA